MTAVLLRRAVSSIPILFLVSVMVFGFVHMVPGDPAITLAGEYATAEQIDEIRANLGLDQPLWRQYVDWVSGAVRGDLGDSLFNGRAVSASITERLPVTLSLTALAVVFALAIAIPCGTVAALRRGRPADTTVTLAASMGLAIPNFFLGLLLVLLFAVRLGWLPATGYVGLTDDPLDWALHLLLPAATLGTAAAAELARQLRASLSDTLDADYIRTARAKGLRARSVVGHASRNAAVPVVTVLGFQIAFLLGGSVIVEQLFALPGIGGLAINAVLDRDIPVIQGVVLLAAVIVIVVNFLVDISYTWLNPKVRAS